MAFVIGVAGQAQNGKDTLADRLCDRLNAAHNYKVDLLCGAIGDFATAEEMESIPDTDPWKRASFAANVKKVFCETFGVDIAFIEEWKVKTEVPPGFDMPCRSALQFIGDGFRKIRSTIWMDLTFRDKSPKIISDVRYVNEFTRIKQEGGLNILVARTDRLNNDPNGSEAQIRPFAEWALRAHSSDSKFVNLRDSEHYAMLRKVLEVGDQPPEGMELFDVFIRNDGTKDEFYETIETKLVPFVQQFPFNFDTGETCPTSN